MKALWPSVLLYAALFGLAADAQTIQPSGGTVANPVIPPWVFTATSLSNSTAASNIILNAGGTSLVNTNILLLANSGGSTDFFVLNAQSPFMTIKRSVGIGWTSADANGGTQDAFVSSPSAGNISVDATTVGDGLGAITARGFAGGGTAPATRGSCSFGGFVGGNTVGTFVAQGCGPPATAATAMVLVFTSVAPNGWVCDTADRTSNLASGATVQALTQNASTVTGASFRASTLTGDVIQWKCMAY